MTSENLLDAVGLLDDDLLQEAEQPARKQSEGIWRRWIPLAACLAVVAVMSYRLTQVEFVSGGAASGSAGAAGENYETESSCGNGAVPDEGNPQEPGSAEAVPSVVIGGVTYWANGEVWDGEGLEDAVLGHVGDMGGQDGLALEGSAYTWTKDGLAVEIDGEWLLFDTVPPWER